MGSRENMPECLLYPKYDRWRINSIISLQQYNALQALINPITAKLDYLECIIPPRPVPAYQAYPYGYNNGCNNGCGCSASTTVTPA